MKHNQKKKQEEFVEGQLSRAATRNIRGGEETDPPSNPDQKGSPPPPPPDIV